MKAVAIKDVKKFEIIDIEEPISDSENVIIEIDKAGICGSDIHYFENGGPKGLIMGHEFSGRVVDNGNRSDLKVGDKVTALPISPCNNCSACLSNNPQYCSNTWSEAIGLSLGNPGGFTNKIKVRADMVFKVDDNSNMEHVCLTEPIAVSLHAVNLIEDIKDKKVLVIGAGIIGLGCMMFAKLKGCKSVTVLETNENRGKKSLELNLADSYCNPTDEQMLLNLMSEIGEGFDVVIECCGNENAVNSSLILSKPGATVILVGVSTSKVPCLTSLAVTKELTLKGAIAYKKEEFSECLDLITNKTIDVSIFIDEIIGLNEVEDAFLRLMSGETNSIKILVDPKK